MKITEELLWEYVANRVTPEESAFIKAAIEKDKTLADDIEKIQLMHGSIKTILAQHMERVSENISIGILQRINELEAKKAQKEDNLLLYIIFTPLILLLAASYLVFFKDAEFDPVEFDPTLPALAVIMITVLLLSSIGARYVLHRMNIHKM